MGETHFRGDVLNDLILAVEAARIYRQSSAKPLYKTQVNKMYYSVVSVDLLLSTMLFLLLYPLGYSSINWKEQQ